MKQSTVRNKRGSTPETSAFPKVCSVASGFTILELIAAVTIVAVIAGMAVPLIKNSVKRDREKALKIAHPELRIAIDKYKEASARGQIQQVLGTEGYPVNLEIWLTVPKWLVRLMES